MPKSTPTPKKEQSLTLPQIEKLLTEQTSVILQAVDEKLSAQDKRMRGSSHKKSESWLLSTNAWQRRKNALPRVWMN